MIANKPLIAYIFGTYLQKVEILSWTADR